MFDLRRELKEGLLFGIGFIALNILFGISIGFPLLSFETFFEKYGIVSILAPFAEELLWGSLLIVLFMVFLPKPLALAANAFTFMAFHFAAYGASFEAANASFIGAFIYRIIADTLILNQHDDTSKLPIPVAAIVAHIIINTYLVIKITGLIIVGV